jgi:DNA-binding NtrC family response regulator
MCIKPTHIAAVNNPQQSVRQFDAWAPTNHFIGARVATRNLAEDNAVSLDELVRAHITRVLAEHGGNVSAAARALGMHRRTLQRKLQRQARDTSVPIKRRA